MNVLLLGDSIRLFYQEEVAKQLGDDYNVYGPNENCRFSLFMLNSLRFWMNDFPTPDIIHFNAGLWDVAILYPEDGCFVKIDDYLKNIKAIIRELKKTGAKLIFATSTPVSDKKEFLPGPMPPAVKNCDIMNYNSAVLEMLKQEDVEIDDLFSLIYPERERYICEDLIHPTEEGTKLLAMQVANSIKSVGRYINSKSYSRIENEINEKTLQ